MRRAAFLMMLVVLLAGPAVAQDERNTVTRLIEWASGGQVRLVGLEGWLPGAPRAGRIEVHDARGAWLVLEEVTAQWSSLALLRGRAQVQSLTAARAVVHRQPAGAGGGGGGGLPMPVAVDALRIGRLEVMPAASGLAEAVVVSVSGAMDLAALDQGTLRLLVEGVDRPGRLSVEGRLAPDSLALAVAVEEPADGLVAGIARLPDLGALKVTARLDGPRTAPALRLDATAGALTLTASGLLAPDRIALDVAARAPAMAPGPDLAWQAIEIDTHLAGPPAAPAAKGRLLVEGLRAGETRLARIAATLSGDAGRVRLEGRAEQVQLPAPLGDVLRAAPLELAADLDLQAEGRPVALRLTHPLLVLAGTVRTAGVPEVHLVLDLPTLDPLAAELSGSAQVRLDLRLPAEGAEVQSSGWVRLGAAPVPALAGRETRFALAATRRGERTVVERLTLDSPALRLSGHGSFDADGVAADLDAVLPELALVAAPLLGEVRLGLRLAGRVDDFAIDLTGEGTAGTADFAKLPLSLSGRASGLPGAPEARARLSATLEGAKLDAELAGGRAADGTIRLDVPALRWKSARATASLVLPPGAPLPHGTVQVEVGAIQELRPFLPGAPAGSLRLDASREAGGALRAEASARGLPPFASVTLQADGLPEALMLRLSARDPGSLDAAATLDVPGRTLLLSSLRGTLQDRPVALRAPARLALGTAAWGDEMRVDRLLVDIAGGTVEAAGRIAPTLDLRATVRGVPASALAPELAGTLQADASLAGTLAAPAGTVRLSASGLRWSGAATLPPSSLTATATLEGGSARIDARASAGPAQVAVNGAVPLGAGALALRVTGRAPLSLLDPILAAQGQRVRGDITVDAQVSGPAAAPNVAGTLLLARGEVQDFALGLRLRDIAGTVRADGRRLVIESLTGRAGPGTVSLTGTATLEAAPTLDLALVARNARPVASDLLSAVLDADLALRGKVGEALAASGRIGLQRVEIRIPERMPARLPTLPIRLAGAPPAPPRPPPPPIALDIRVTAPGNVFVRGRGLEAELAGEVAVGGTLAAPRPDGGLTLRRGSFDLLGTKLTLTEGRVMLDGSGALDPAIDFAASSRRATTTATVRVTGHASAPEIRLTAEPELPQDEILAQLLLGRSLNQVSAFQAAQIAAGLAELSGQGGGFDPLGRIRGGLGLDRLSLGSTESGATTLEAGRNIAPGVYLGVRQGTGDSGTRATVQIDIGRGLKLQGEVGTSTGTPSATGAGDSGSSVGVVWSREW